MRNWKASEQVGLERDKSECGADQIWDTELQAEEDGEAGADSPGPVALPDRLVSRRRSLEGEGTRMAARKARDRGR